MLVIVVLFIALVFIIMCSIVVISVSLIRFWKIHNRFTKAVEITWIVFGLIMVAAMSWAVVQKAGAL